MILKVQFLQTREDNDTKGTVFARNLIQSFIFGKFGAIKKAMSLMLTAFFLYTIESII